MWLPLNDKHHDKWLDMNYPRIDKEINRYNRILLPFFYCSFCNKWHRRGVVRFYHIIPNGERQFNKPFNICEDCYKAVPKIGDRKKHGKVVRIKKNRVQ